MEAPPPPETPLKKLLRAAAQYSVGSIVTMLASIARVGVTARVLTDSENGIWLGLQLLLNYAGNLHLGSVYGAFRSVPLLRARGEVDAAEREKQTSFTFVLVMAAVGAAGIALLAPRLSRATSMRHVVLVMALLAANLLRMYFIAIVKAESRFKELSSAWVIGAIVTCVGLAFIAKWRLDGLLVTMLAQTLVESAYLALFTGIPRLKIDRTLLKSQLRVGLMTLAVTVGTIALTSADRTVMLRLCGAKATGLYYLGANIVTLLPAFALMPAAVLTPQFFERVGRGEDLMPLVERPLKVLAVFAAAVSGGGAVFLPAVVHRIWPNHVGGIPAALVALFSTAPIVLSGLVTNVYYALDRQRRHVVILVVSAAAAYAFGAVGVVLAGNTIVGAVSGAAIATTGYYVACLGAAVGLVGARRASDGIVMALVSLAPTAAVLAALAIIGVTTRTWLNGGLGGAVVALVAVTVALVPFLPGAVRSLRGVRAGRLAGA